MSVEESTIHCQALPLTPIPSYDVDPQKRKESPDFYGYIPDGGGRALIFGCMMLNSALLLLIRSFSATMLMIANKRYLMIYMAGDMALYLLQKVAREDLHYWFPIDGAFGLFVSLLARVIVKTVIDFTGIIQFRGPQELGGVYWTASMFLAVAASFASVWIGGGERMHWTLLGAASGAWVLVFTLFLLVMKKEYRRTFVSTRTGKQQIMDRFSKADDDAIKASVMKRNKKMWWPIRGEVKEWVLENYWRWDEEKPTWFTEAWLAKLPSDMIPVEAEKNVKGIRVRENGRRRSSVEMVKGMFGKGEEEVRVGGRVEPVA